MLDGMLGINGLVKADIGRGKENPQRRKVLLCVCAQYLLGQQTYRQIAQPSLLPKLIQGRLTVVPTQLQGQIRVKLFELQLQLPLLFKGPSLHFSPEIFQSKGVFPVQLAFVDLHLPVEFSQLALELPIQLAFLFGQL